MSIRATGEQMTVTELRSSGRSLATKPSAATLNADSQTLDRRKVAEEFASLLLLEMLKSMRATLSGVGVDGESSPGRETYSALADVEVTRSLAKQDGTGLAAFIERSLDRATSPFEVRQNETSVDPQLRDSPKGNSRTDR